MQDSEPPAFSFPPSRKIERGERIVESRYGPRYLSLPSEFIAIDDQVPRRVTPKSQDTIFQENIQLILWTHHIDPQTGLKTGQQQSKFEPLTAAEARTRLSGVNAKLALLRSI
jgi:hypothetical protein